MTPQIPFLDLVSLHREMKNDFLAVLDKAIDTAGFIGGPLVGKFEEEFARFCTSRYCIAVGNGTDALRFAYIAGGIKPGDEVITVPNTFIATTESITQAGAHIVFVDIDQRTCTMDPAKLRGFLESGCVKEKTSGKTRNRVSGRPVTGVVPVHLYGHPADMDAIMDIAAEWATGYSKMRARPTEPVTIQKNAVGGVRQALWEPRRHSVFTPKKARRPRRGRRDYHR